MIDAAGRPGSVVVLGGASEIGLAIARALVRRGAPAVVLAGRHPEALAEAAALLRAERADSPPVEPLPFDAADLESHEATIARAFERAHVLGGDVGVVLVAFGVLIPGDPLDAATDSPRVALVNFTGAVSASLTAARALRAQGRGALVVLSSVAARRARPGNFVYSATKAGLDTFLEGLGDALYGTGVEVVSVRPGYVRTRMVADFGWLPLAVSAEHVADDVMRGLDRRARVVWSPSVMRWIALAMRATPRPLWRLAARVIAPRR